MVDPRIVQLAKLLTSYSINISKGDLIEINSMPEARPLILELMKNILLRGAYPKLNLGIPGAQYTYYRHASLEQIQHFPELALHDAKKVNGAITIGAAANTKELTNIDPTRIAMRRKVTKPISEAYLKKNNWVLFEYPTNALAQDAEMSLEEFEDFVFNACLIDYAQLTELEKKQKALLDKGKTVRIVGPGTDLSFSIEGRQGILCNGKRNMPDGEVFIAPVETSTEGHIAYDFPAIYSGREVDGIKLEFRKGKVIKATATKNEAFLHQMLNIDKGAKYLGEFGWGDNFGIKKFVKQILFDEKIGGTVHLALGMAYKEGGGKNDSALHWDMIKDLRKEGTLYIDDKPVMKDGRFLF